MSVLSLTLFGCTAKERIKASDMRYVIKETDDLEDILSYVRAINFKNVKVYTKDELKENKDLEDKFWQDVIDNTEYIRIPKGYVDGFKLRKFLSVEYIYKNYINGSPSIPWEKECEYVMEFFEKKVFERLGL